MKKFFVAFAMVMATIIAVAQSQFYVIMKDGSGASFPEATVDSLTFNDENGATIYGLKDLANSIAQLRKEVDSLKLIVKVNDSGKIDEFVHEYVDLGLPSGTLWATTNVGANKAHEYGKLFSWGATYEYSSLYKLAGKSIADLQSENIIDSHNNLTEKYDAATMFWGNDWRMPTSDEVEELIKHCSSEWTELNGVNGILFTASNGNSIFLPCAGYISNLDNTLIAEGERGYYQNATLEVFGGGSSSYTLYLFQDKVYNSSMNKAHGKSVRPVRKKDTDITFINKDSSTIDGHEFVDLGLPSGRLWATDDIIDPEPYYGYGLFQWAETVPEHYSNDKAHYFHGDFTLDSMIANDIVDKHLNFTSKYDAASQIWSPKWRTPTKDDYIELLKNCKIEYHKETLLKPELMKFTGPNGKSIEFHYLDKSRWTSTASKEGSYLAYAFGFPVDDDKNRLIPTEENGSIVDFIFYISELIRPVSDMIIKK